MKSIPLSQSRKNSVLAILSLISISISLKILYVYFIEECHLDSILTYDMYNSITHIIIYTVISVYIVGALFREIRHSFLSDGIIIRRFLPLIRAISIGIVWGTGGFYILDAIDINTSSILTGAGIGGVLLAIASRDIITNLFGSLTILLSQTFDIGDIIRIQLKSSTPYEGLVEEITLNYTKITRLTGEVVFIPNRLIYNESFENISRRRFFTYTYRIPFKQASNAGDVKISMHIIESKIATYDPIEVLYKTEVPNAIDLIYEITIMLPEEDEQFDYDMRHFLMEHIFIDPFQSLIESHE